MDIKSHQGGDASLSLAVGMSLGAYFHPSKLGEAMNSMCMSRAR